MDMSEGTTGTLVSGKKGRKECPEARTECGRPPMYGTLQSRELVYREVCGLGDLLEKGIGVLSEDKIAVYR